MEEQQLEQLTEIKKIEGAIDAILFAAGHPVTYDKIAETLSLSKRDTKRITEHMAEARNSDETAGIMMLLFDDSCQLCSREYYLPYVRYALGIKRGGNLSPSALEALAVIAYNQPAIRSFVDQVRGVDSTYAVNTLLEKGLIEGVGRMDAPGRPMLYATTEKFLRVFGLSSIADLPENGSIEAAMASIASGAETPAEEEQDASLFDQPREVTDLAPDADAPAEAPAEEAAANEAAGAGSTPDENA